MVSHETLSKKWQLPQPEQSKIHTICIQLIICTMPLADIKNNYTENICVNFAQQNQVAPDNFT
jgi:hypothetical protein